jgi:hypothetical protein
MMVGLRVVRHRGEAEGAGWRQPHPAGCCLLWLPRPRQLLSRLLSLSIMQCLRPPVHAYKAGPAMPAGVDNPGRAGLECRWEWP